MFASMVKWSFICATILWSWAIAANNEIAEYFFSIEIAILTLILIFHYFGRIVMWVAWRLTYDVKYWNGPTITFEGHDKKFLPILHEVGTWSKARRDKYDETFSDEDRELYWTTYTEEVAEWNRQQEREYNEWVASGGPEREAAYEANRRAEKAEKQAIRENERAFARQKEANRQAQNAFDRQAAAANRNAAIAANKARNTYPVKAPSYKQPEKYIVQEMRPGMSKYTNRTVGTDLMNANKQLEGAKRQRANIQGSEKIKYRIVDKDGKVQ